ncbi:MAG: phosphohydrolase [Thermoplasmata archaeon]
MVHANEGTDEDQHAFWLTTSSGLKFYPKDPEGSEYRIEDIAHALSLTCRFAGQCREFYSCAEHSVLVALVAYRLNRKLGPWGLMHDASEAYVVDIPRPIKYLPEMEGYRVLERRVMSAILKRFGLPDQEPPDVKTADRLVLRSEAETLGLLNEDWDVFDWPEIPERPVPFGPKEAETRFLEAAHDFGVIE